jgi:hypothetical protein
MMYIIPLELSPDGVLYQTVLVDVCPKTGDLLYRCERALVEIKNR